MAIDKEKLYESLIDDAVYADDDKEREYIKNLARSLDSIPENEFNQWVIANGEGIFKSLPKDNPLYQMAAKAKDPKSWQNTTPDLETMFNNKDIVYDYQDMPEERIEGVAIDNGYLPEHVKKALEEQRTIQKRKDNMWPEWAWPTGVPGRGIANALLNGVQQVFTPRLYEKRLREGVKGFDDWSDVLSKDMALDLGENAAYMFNPGGRAAGLGLRGTGLTSRAAKAGIGAMATPLLMETADAVAYDDPDNDRSKFSLGDVAMGTGTNIAAPLSIKSLAGGAGILAGSMGKRDMEFLKKLYQLGGNDERAILEQIMMNNKRFDKIDDIVSKKGLGALNDVDRTFYNEWKKLDNIIDRDTYEAVLKSKGNTLAEKYEDYLKSTFNQPLAQNKTAQRSTDIVNGIENSNYADVLKGKPHEQALAEQFATDFVTNKYGDIEYDDDKSARAPVVGWVAKKIRESENDEAEKQAKKAAIKKHKVPSVSMMLEPVEIKGESPDIDDLEKIIARDASAWEIGIKPWSGFQPSAAIANSPEVRAYRLWESRKKGAK